MKNLLIIPYYIRWHYSRAFVEIYENWGNSVWFLWYFFSTGILFKTFFQPWKRLNTDMPKQGEKSQDTFVDRLIVNTLMRLVGMIARLILILISFLSIFFTTVISLFLFFTWIILPVLIVAMVINGVKNIVL
jgi:hypothetical protein